MITVHPAFDPTTRTWFVPDMEFEAPSLSELQELMGPQVVIRDYYPLRRTIAAAVAERLVPLTLQPIETLRQIGGPAREIAERREVARGRKLSWGRERADGRPKVRIDRDMLRRLWEQGMSGREIAERLGTTPRCLTATVAAMRRAGVPLERRCSNHIVRGDHHV